MTDVAPHLDDIYSRAYEELHRLAVAVGQNDARATLSPTELVNEAYLKLSGSLRATPESRLHFKRIAARAMRQVLIEAARRRNALKRGGDVAFVTFDEELDGAIARSGEVLSLDEALDRLARMNPRQAQLVECRYFGGFSVAETAEILGISESTVLRDWRVARAWLAVELGRAEAEPGADGHPGP